MPKTIKSITLIVLIFILGLFFISLNKNTDYDTEHLIGNKLNKINTNLWLKFDYYKIVSV